MLRKDNFVTGEYYHIYNRGIDKRIIFKSKRDYERFVMLLHLANSNRSLRLDDILNKQHKIFSDILLLDKGEPIISIGAWCLMTNHFHLLIRQEVDGGITKFMRKLGVGYSYMRHLFGYIHINPLEIEFPNWEDQINNSSVNMKKFLESYRYSSYLDYLGKDRIEKNIINPENFPDYFLNSQSFRDFVESYFIEE